MVFLSGTLNGFFSRLLAFDTAALGFVNHNRIAASVPFLVFITDTAYLVSFTVPFVIFFIAKNNRKPLLLKISLQLFLSLITSTIITNVLKYTINRPRPFITNSFIEKLSTGGSPSFPSGHTADAFVMAVSVTLVSGKQLKYVLPVWIWALTVAYSRIVLGVHYPSDVIGSMLIGLACALFGRWFITKRTENNL
jgi:undecaprenyl-diphosphatase